MQTKYQQNGFEQWTLHLRYIVEVEQQRCSPLKPVFRDHVQREGILPPAAKQSLRTAQSKRDHRYLLDASRMMPSHKVDDQNSPHNSSM